MSGMKRSIAAALIALTAVTGFMASDDKANAEAGDQELCPVMDFSVTSEFYTDYRGKRIYFCCSPCPSDFRDDPDMYMEQMRAQNIILADAPV